MTPSSSNRRGTSALHDLLTQARSQHILDMLLLPALNLFERSILKFRLGLPQPFLLASGLTTSFVRTARHRSSVGRRGGRLQDPAMYTMHRCFILALQHPSSHPTQGNDVLPAIIARLTAISRQRRSVPEPCLKCFSGQPLPAHYSSPDSL